MDNSGNVYSGGVRIPNSGIEKRVEVMEKTIDKFGEKLEATTADNRKLELAMAGIDSKLSSLVDAVKDISKIARESIATVEKINTVKEDIEILFRDNKEFRNKIEKEIKEKEDKVERAFDKRDKILIGVISTMGTILAGFFIWYIQNIGDK